MAIYSCDHGDSIVVYEKKCPLCEAEDDINDKEQQIKELESELEAEKEGE
jgi:hypothetical protein